MTGSELAAWRKARRAELIALREAMPQEERRAKQDAIEATIRAQFTELSRGIIGFYWPFRGEMGFHRLVRDLTDAGARAALPVVVEKNQPLQFRTWQPGAPMTRGVWNIPVPAEGAAVRPTALIVPLVGFDGARYRLGYGGGYYDRTLAVMDPRPLTIGVGFEAMRLKTIHPEPHDIPMTAIVTEAGVLR